MRNNEHASTRVFSRFIKSYFTFFAFRYNYIEIIAAINYLVIV